MPLLLQKVEWDAPPNSFLTLGGGLHATVQSALNPHLASPDHLLACEAEHARLSHNFEDEFLKLFFNVFQ
ncbi:hypothetical protein TNCV_3771531 [Trichonephila clavipes]|nr:hypothetical protein TNCV_3771531 [Trichonephila clavipes]